MVSVDGEHWAYNPQRGWFRYSMTADGVNSMGNAPGSASDQDAAPPATGVNSQGNASTAAGPNGSDESWTQPTPPEEDVVSEHPSQAGSLAGSHAGSQAESWHSNWSYSGWRNQGWGYGGGGPTNRDGDIPEWDGKSTHRTVYFRKIDLWESTTGVPKFQRALRLLQKLTGDAFDKTEHLDTKKLMVDDGVEMFKNYIIELYEPIEDYRVGKIMDAFLDDFSRKKDQEIVDFNREWAKELAKAEKVAGKLADKWQAHLYMKKIRLSGLQKTQVLTGTLGDYSVPALQKAALTTFPSMKDAFGKKEASSGYNSHSKHKKGFMNRHHKRNSRKPFRRTHKAHETEHGEDEDSGEDPTRRNTSLKKITVSIRPMQVRTQGLRKMKKMPKVMVMCLMSFKKHVLSSRTRLRKLRLS